MLGSIRKFSGSIYAKILLGIVVIPFVFWGMGDVFNTGTKNVVVKIDKEKYSIEEFGEYITRNSPRDEEINADQIENFLSAFIGEKLIEKEVEHFGIKLSDNTLGKLLKHQKGFKRENVFSRIEYEKFLIANNITAAYFENNLLRAEKKKQLLDFIGGGAIPSKFMVNYMYDNINQKRNIEIINLNEFFKKKIKFNNDQINSYFKNNKEKYVELYKSIKLLELNPKKLIGNEDFSDIFFKKIDEIDELIVQGKNLDSIIKKFKLESPEFFTIDRLGKDVNSNKVMNLNKNLIDIIYQVDDIESTLLVENSDKYFIVEFLNAETIQKQVTNIDVKNDILLNLTNAAKRKLIAEIISKIKKNNFSKIDFNNLSKESDVPISKINLKNQSDNSTLDNEIVRQIYSHPEKKVIVVNDINLTQNFLIYIVKIENVNIAENSEGYKKYVNLSKMKIANTVYNTYDMYIKKRYKIDINYQALDTVKNYFN